MPEAQVGPCLPSDLGPAQRCAVRRIRTGYAPERVAGAAVGTGTAEAQKEAQRTLAQYQERLAEARHEAARIREEAREQGAQIIAEMREQGRAEMRRLTEAARAQIVAERERARTELRAEMGTLAVELAGRILGESLADEAHQNRAVDRFLDELEAGSVGGGAPPRVT